MEYDDQRQREVVAPAAKRAPVPPHPLLALQQGAGNAAVSRAVLSSKTSGSFQDARRLARNRNMIQQQYDDARKERDTFVAAGKKGPQTYNPSTNNAANYYGGFDVEYEPTKGELNVKLKGAVAFQDGMTLSAAGRAQAVEPSAQTAAAAAAINRMPKAARAAEVAKWTWSSNGGPDASDETDLLTVQIQQYEELARTTALITSSHSLKEVLEGVTDTIVKLTHAERAYLMIFDEAIKTCIADMVKDATWFASHSGSWAPGGVARHRHRHRRRAHTSSGKAARRPCYGSRAAI